jgi:phosphoenolpyruvate carboxykinase (GTP)
LSINLDAWREEMQSVGEYLDSYGKRLPAALKKEQETVLEDLKKAD